MLVQLELEEGRNAGTCICYVAQVLEVLPEGKVSLSFLRMKNAIAKSIFTFPAVVDEAVVELGQCKGVLTTSKGGTKRQANVVNVLPPLLPFNMFF